MESRPERAQGFPANRRPARRKNTQKPSSSSSSAAVKSWGNNQSCAAGKRPAAGPWGPALPAFCRLLPCGLPCRPLLCGLLGRRFLRCLFCRFLGGGLPGGLLCSFLRRSRLLADGLLRWRLLGRLSGRRFSCYRLLHRLFRRRRRLRRGGFGLRPAEGHRHGLLGWGLGGFHQIFFFLFLLVLFVFLVVLVEVSVALFVLFVVVVVEIFHLVFVGWHELRPIKHSTSLLYSGAITHRIPLFSRHAIAKSVGISRCDAAVSGGCPASRHECRAAVYRALATITGAFCGWAALALWVVRWTAEVRCAGRRDAVRCAGAAATCATGITSWSPSIASLDCRWFTD